MDYFLNISPIDGRYKNYTKDLNDYFSEYALMKYRVYIEIEYFISLLDLNLNELLFEDILNNGNFENKTALIKKLRGFYLNFNSYDAELIKSIEKITNHDVKAIEYFLINKFKKIGLENYETFIHFGLTSQDINNSAVSLSIKNFSKNILENNLNKIKKKLLEYVNLWKNCIMISRTHGQPAVPTSMGKEFKVFEYRLGLQIKKLENFEFYSKFGGASGNLNAHCLAYPNIGWQNFGNKFLLGIGLTRSDYTTQIDSYDNLAEYFDLLKRINNILIDFCKDIWQYISMNYFKMKYDANQIGSSTMPHKINPINFENSEGNLMLANNFLEFFSRKLPISRLQRDLTDSTVLRNIGTAFGHIIISTNNILKGLNKLEINNDIIDKDLNENRIVITEGIQTILRKYKIKNAYEIVKDFSRHNNISNEDEIRNFINNLNIDTIIKNELLNISIRNYIGYCKDI